MAPLHVKNIKHKFYKTGLTIKYLNLQARCLYNLLQKGKQTHQTIYFNEKSFSVIFLYLIVTLKNNYMNQTLNKNMNIT